MGKSMITVQLLAKNWNFSVEEMMQLMKVIGVSVSSSNAPLEQEELVKIRTGILELQKKQKEQQHVKQQVTKEETMQMEQTPEMKQIEKYVKECYIFIDTCSLFQPEAMTFLGRLCFYLLQEKKKLYIPSKVVGELKKVSDAKPEYKTRYQELRQLIYKMDKQGILSLRGEESDNFADNVFLTQFTKYRLKYPLLLITQDRKLAADIRNLNKIRSQKGYPVTVQRISNKGYLEEVPFPN